MLREPLDTDEIPKKIWRLCKVCQMKKDRKSSPEIGKSMAGK